MKSLNKNQRGFTITELLISITVATILITAVMTITFGFYGNILIENQKSRLTLESTQILRSFTEQLRTASALRTVNSITDANKTGGWTTSDTNNVLIVVIPTVNDNNDFIIDPLNSTPYDTEVIYYQTGKFFYRRYLVPSGATNSRNKTTCPTATATCPIDGVLTPNFKDLTFTFYDVNNAITTNATLARSVKITITLEKKVAGKLITQSNTVRMTMRNSL